LSGLIDSDPIGGNPVYIVVDFEYQAGFFEENAHGGRVRQQIGDHLSVGGSYVRDDEGLTPYELNAGDLEVRFGKGTRILGEFASSRGAGSETTFSPDGGLSFTPVTAGKDPEGRAYKASLETDVGELFGNPGQYRLKAYLKDIEAGYSSNGTILEQGTRKAGLGATFRMSRFNTLHLRYEGQRILDNGNFLSQVQVGGRSSYTETVQWTRNKGKLTMTGEFQAKELNSGGEDIRSQTTAIRADYRLTNNLLVYSGQQLTLGGPVQNKTMGGSEYRIGRYRAFGEASTGTLGEGLRAGLSREVGSSGIISISHDIRNDSEVGRSSQSIFHAENRIGQGTRVYTEYQMNQTETADSNASVAGVNQRWGISEALSINLLGEIGRRVQEGETIIRQTAGAGLQMQRLERFRFSDYFELRYERGNERKLQVLTRNHAELWLGRDFRLLAGVNASLTQNRSIENTEARSSELSAG
ncbi:MAG TPA: hypothetical protein VLB09_05475, partial [Nitrospiria bacterium]|nr:hypothetical protein [Nitrospiria bacterium]